MLSIDVSVAPRPTRTPLSNAGVLFRNHRTSSRVSGGVDVAYIVGRCAEGTLLGKQGVQGDVEGAKESRHTYLRGSVFSE